MSSSVETMQAPFLQLRSQHGIICIVNIDSELDLDLKAADCD